MRNLILLVLFFCVTSFAFTAIPLEIQIDQAISNLGHADFFIRQKAFKILEEEILPKKHAKKILKRQVHDLLKTTTHPEVRSSLERLNEHFEPYSWIELITEIDRALSELKEIQELHWLQQRIVFYTTQEDLGQLNDLVAHFKNFDESVMLVADRGTGIKSEDYKSRVDAHRVASIKWEAIQNKILENFKVLTSIPLVQKWNFFPENLSLEQGNKTIFEESGVKYEIITLGHNLEFRIQPQDPISFKVIQGIIDASIEECRDLPHQLSKDRFKEFEGRIHLSGSFDTYSSEAMFNFPGFSSSSLKHAIGLHLMMNFPEYSSEIEQAMEIYMRNGSG